MSSEQEVAAALYNALITPHLFGILVGTLLAGLLISQLLTYYTGPILSKPTRKLDAWVVGVITASSTILLAVDWWNVYSFTVHHRLSTMYPMTFHLPDFITVPLAAVCTTAAQVWFMERAWKVTNKNLVFLIVNSAFILTAFSAAFAILIISQTTADGGADPAYFSLMAHLTIVVLWSNAIADVISTSVLVWKVLDTPISKSHAVREITHLAFTTGALTSSAALAGGAVYLVTRMYSNAFIPFIDGLPRLCALSCMITLNYRQRWRESRQELLAQPRGDSEYVTGDRHSRLPTDSSPTSTQYESSPETTVTIDKSAGAISDTSFGQSYFVLNHTRVDDEAVSGLHMSEIGDLSQLERKLKYYQQNEGDLSPRRVSVIMCEKPSRPSFSKDENRRSSGGVIVETQVSRTVELSP